jgi:hypothetical protein
MRASRVRRLIVVSAAPIGTVPSPGHPHPPRHDPGDGFVIRYLAGPIIRRALRAHYADLAEMEDVLRDSDLDWTAVRPPRLTGKPVTGRYRTAYGQNVRGGIFVSRADVAHYMLGALDRPETFRRTVGIANSAVRLPEVFCSVLVLVFAVTGIATYWLVWDGGLQVVLRLAGHAVVPGAHHRT